VDIVVVIDDVIIDGVDVINYLVGDNVDNFSVVELVFLNVVAFGVFVFVVVGNVGFGASMVDNVMLWEIMVVVGIYD